MNKVIVGRSACCFLIALSSNCQGTLVFAGVLMEMHVAWQTALWLERIYISHTYTMLHYTYHTFKAPCWLVANICSDLPDTCTVPIFAL